MKKQESKAKNIEKNEDIKDLFIEELSDMFDGEEQIIKALPEMIREADNPDLKDALQTHLEETKNQLHRLKKVFNIINSKPTGEKCTAMKGLIEEAKEGLKEFEKSPLKDAAIIAKAQRIEHYEISVYGTLRTFAKQLNLEDAVELLNETLKEESHADKHLSKIAEGGFLTTGVNEKATSREI